MENGQCEWGVRLYTIIHSYIHTYYYIVLMVHLSVFNHVLRFLPHTTHTHTQHMHTHTHRRSTQLAGQ